MVYLMPFKYFLLHSLSHLLFIGKLWSLESKLWNTLHTIWILNFINRGRIISDGYDCFTYECVVSCMAKYVDLTSAISSTDVGLYLTGCSSSRTFSVVLSGSFFGLNIRMCSLQRCCQRGYKWISFHWLPLAWKVEKSLGVMDETLPNWHFLGKNWCLQGTQFRIDGR